MFNQFSEILMQFISKFEESSMRPHSSKIGPFKVQINLDILNLEQKVDIEFVDNWVQQLQSYYFMNPNP